MNIGEVEREGYIEPLIEPMIEPLAEPVGQPEAAPVEPSLPAAPEPVPA